VEKLFVSGEGKIGREVENDCRVPSVAAINGHLALAHSASGFPVLDLHRTVVSLDYVGVESLSLQAFPERFNGKRASEEPIAERRARDGGIFAFEDSRLAIVRMSASSRDNPKATFSVTTTFMRTSHTLDMQASTMFTDLIRRDARFWVPHSTSLTKTDR